MNKNYIIPKYIVIAVSILLYLLFAILILTKTYTPIGIKESIAILILFIGVVVAVLPLLFECIFKLRYTLVAWIIFEVFCLLTMGLGSGLGIYNIFSAFDFILHFSSGIIVAFLTYATFYKHINPSDTPKTRIFYTLLFALSFAVLVGIIWEIWEFSTDHLMHLNCQRYADVNNVDYVGHEAVIDTMMDIIADFVGGLISAGALSLYYIFSKHEVTNLLTFRPNKKVQSDTTNVDNNSNDIK